MRNWKGKNKKCQAPVHANRRRIRGRRGDGCSDGGVSWWSDRSRISSAREGCVGSSSGAPVLRAAESGAGKSGVRRLRGGTVRVVLRRRYRAAESAPRTILSDAVGEVLRRAELGTAHLSQYLESVERGEIVILCRRNVPIAEIRPIPKLPVPERPIGTDPGLKVPDSFFEPLPQ